MPPGWFVYAAEMGLSDMVKVIDEAECPVLGTQLTIVWLLDWNKCSKNLVKCEWIRIASVIQDRMPGSQLVIVTQVPATQYSPEVVNYNKKNLAIVERQARKKSNVQIKLINLHRWCLAQQKGWNTIDEITGEDVKMMAFIILIKVRKILGLADDVTQFD